MKIKLISLGVSAILVSVMITGWMAFQKSSSALEDAAIKQLKSVAKTKSDNIEDYFRQTRNDIITMALGEKVKQALVELSAARSQLVDDLKNNGFETTDQVINQIKSANQQYYHNVLIANLKKTSSKDPGLPEQFMHPNIEANLLQYIYTIKNPAPIGSKDQNNDSSDIAVNSNIREDFRTAFSNTDYCKAHDRIHRYFSDHRSRYGYYDIFLVDPNGFVVYTNFKELDFNGNLLYGPQKSTGLGEAFQMSLRHQTRMIGADVVEMTDFAYYSISYNAPAKFISHPVYIEGLNTETVFIGTIIFQLPIDKIDQVTNVNYDYEKAGLGKTGEAFLIGSDGFLRTNVRFLEGNEAARMTIESDGQDGKGTVILSLKLDDTVTKDIFSSKDDKSIYTGFITSYMGNKALISSKILNIKGMDTAIVVQMDEEEILAPARNIFRTMLLLGLLVILIGGALFALFSLTLTKPIEKTTNVLSSTSSQIATTIDEQEKTSAQQSTSINEITTTMEELNRSSQMTAEQADNVSLAAKESLEHTQQGSEIVEMMRIAMNTLQEKVSIITDQIVHLSEQTNQIKGIAGLVTELADETHMLALNAAVEAARAGEHGKGFAVVAFEVRKLADESKKSAAKIDVLVADILKANYSTVMAAEDGAKRVFEGVELAEKSASTYDMIRHSADAVVDNTQQITLNIKQQAQAIGEVLEAMNSINVGVKESSLGISQTRDGIHELNDAAKGLQKLL